MPLKKGTSKKVFSDNVSELMHSFHKGGRFARGKPVNKARKMALAAAFSMRRKN